MDWAIIYLVGSIGMCVSMMIENRKGRYADEPNQDFYITAAMTMFLWPVLLPFAIGQMIWRGWKRRAG